MALSGNRISKNGGKPLGSEPKSAGLQRLLQGLSGLTEALSPSELSDIIFHSISEDDQFDSWKKFDSAVYCRTSIAHFEFAEVLLLCWESGQLTPVHDHRGSACVVKVLEGMATEIQYKKSACGQFYPIRTTNSEEGALIVSFDTDLHQMGNLEQAGSHLVTLHCYSPPLTQMNLIPESELFLAEYGDTYRTVKKRLTT